MKRCGSPHGAATDSFPSYRLAFQWPSREFALAIPKAGAADVPIHTDASLLEFVSRLSSVYKHVIFDRHASSGIRFNPKRDDARRALREVVTSHMRVRKD
jgi:hypothetical protein